MSTARTCRTRTQRYGRLDNQAAATDPVPRKTVADLHPWVSPSLLDVLSRGAGSDADDGSWIAPTTVAVFHP